MLARGQGNLMGLSGGGDVDLAAAIHASDTTARRPSAGPWNRGSLYLAADGNVRALYRSTGAAWVQCARGWLVGAQTYYVRTDGSDSNNGLANTAGGAFLTIQKAVDVAAAIDFGGYTVTVQVADGTYTGAVTIKAMTGLAGPTSFVIQGNSSTPANVVISTTSATAFALNGPGVAVYVKDLKVQTTTTGYGFSVLNGAVLYYSNLNFGACAYYHILVANTAIAACAGSYAISGGASYHCFVGGDGTLTAESIGTITLTGTPAFSGAFLAVDTAGTARINGNTFSGSATGSRYSATSNGVIFTNGGGATYLPGNAAGSTATGGQYV